MGRSDLRGASPGSGERTPAAVAPLGLPQGARDLLPAACRLRRAVTATLLSTFEAWGYEPVTTPAIEYFEVLAHGLSATDRRGCVRFIAAGSGELVTLRPDVTPQIVRMLAQRWGGALPTDVVHRLCYAAEVLRQPTSAREQAEVHQVGIELVGDGDLAEDAELLALADASLRAVGLTEFRLDLAHTRVARGLLDALDLPGQANTHAHALLARKDREGLARVLAPLGRPPTLVRAVTALCDLFGDPQQVLPRAREVLADTGVEDAVAELGAVLAHVAALEPSPGPASGALTRLSIDLGEARGFDYYSGIRVRGWAPGVQHPIVRGGRYDGLPPRYGVPRRATGFAIDLDALEAALAHAGRSPAQAEPPPAQLVAIADGLPPRSPEAGSWRIDALRQAQQARAAGRRAWVQPGVTLDRARQLAERAGADRITFIDQTGTTQWAHGPDGWSRSTVGTTGK